MGDHSGVVARAASQLAPVSCLLFHGADDGSFGHGAKGEHVADVQGGWIYEIKQPTFSD